MSSSLYLEILQAARSLKDWDKKRLIDNLKHSLYSEKNINFEGNIYCPFCKSKVFVKNGKLKERQRYLCKKCCKSFNSLSNTPVSYTKKDMGLWNIYLSFLIDGKSLRYCSKELKISLSTAFFWRHKLLDALRENYGTQELQGEIQMDETYFRESFKGNHSKSDFKMPRPAYKRGTAASKRGISREQVCVLTALDNNKRLLIEIATMGRPASNDLVRVLGQVIKRDSTLITDSLNSYKNLACTFNLKHIPIPSGKRSVGRFNIQKINNIHSQTKNFISKYKGVSTKYLSNYLALYKVIHKKIDNLPLNIRGKSPYLIANFKGRPPIFK